MLKTSHAALALLALGLCACHYDWSDAHPVDARADAHVPLDRTEDSTAGLPPSAASSEPEVRCESASDCGDAQQFQCRDSVCRRSPECSSGQTCAQGYVCENERCRSRCELTRCDPHATCALAQGDAVCSCGPDYLQSDAGSCETDASCARLGCAPDARCALDADGARSCACKPGFTGDGKHCERSPCGALQAPEHGRLSQTGMRFGDLAQVECEAGYVAVGSMLRVCQADGNWSEGAGSCEPVNCGALGAPEHGMVRAVEGTRAGQRAEYDCDAGYERQGPAARECQADGSWSAAAPSCSPVRCAELTAPEHGSLRPGGAAVFGERAGYACDEGYALAGPAERTCQPDGQWSAAAPSCEPRSCGPLTDPRDGSVSLPGSPSFGQVASYHCKPGLYLVGSETRTCQANGQWSAAAPSCECSRDLQTDAQNCGACGARCASGVCAAGECARRAFVTSDRFAPGFGSLAQADALCQRAASEAGVDGSFMAWLSDDTASPSTRFVRGKGPYLRLDGLPIASGFGELLAGKLQHPLNVTELGRPADGTRDTYVYTGTQADGTLVRIAPSAANAALGATCQGWKVSTDRAWAAYGTFDTTAASWTYGGNRVPCTTELPLYCFEQ